MNTLVIYTHPNHESLSYAFLQEVLRGSGDNEAVKEIKVLDLYEEGFDPVLVFNKEKRRRDMHSDPGLAKYREQLIWADRIVLVYPIWWGRPPAMLMGYIDQMFASGFAYKDKGGLLPEGLLKGKSVVCISVMKGPANYPLLWLGNAHKILMRKALFNYVGIRKVKFFEFGSMESPRGKHAHKLDRVYRYFKTAR
ncbi:MULTISPECIES: NAD(P)H-dependent oxidoreductase [unclassified Paenibacillus]|uniref:NAD(P)H-dependent oxidoreductase n=1 Tax=unclassified Paenibacillus TaxID=185978 RepID=UPI0024062485|nr:MULTISPECIES: NAD(P)H-dependent oxidoreductase [unclassified Paenibacillus]MDF9839877.1 NAD(P)H dehydrogenase (quinone) [Paenibacillus sp. PastF-2]MDF9846458.1 NAD(P)H dehydrogenase (quinone) [Paenibacillus sp. PastM-2]MDF9853193.1 NAD(P)H dehydrogenase (quinone) [Paenibacillus sp. PastF-1]MDH6478303.1 NAD(P)H dehydrogenase (quinone) [Paenibacillus sp. PastH-2]MDH6506199.1 NAD(P)H dehydrogenase (quinone) [Paenibacillus sp. PastM-3]